MTNHLSQEVSNPVEPSASSSQGPPTNASTGNSGRRGSPLAPESGNTNYLDGQPSTLYKDAPDVESGIHYTIGDPILLHRNGLGAEPGSSVPRGADRT